MQCCREIVGNLSHLQDLLGTRCSPTAVSQFAALPAVLRAAFTAILRSMGICEENKDVGTDSQSGRLSSDRKLVLSATY